MEHDGLAVLLRTTDRYILMYCAMEVFSGYREYKEATRKLTDDSASNLDVW